MTLNYYRFLIHKFNFFVVFSKIGPRPNEYNGSSRAVLLHFWDPLVLNVLETWGGVYGETDQEDILKQN